MSETTASVGQAVAHESAALHVTGTARYTDDIPEPHNTLHAAIGASTHAHAAVLNMDLAAVENAVDVVDVIRAADIPGVNDCGPIIDDDPILAEGVVEHVGQPLFAVAARSVEAARRAATLGEVSYSPKPALIDIEQALAAESFILPTENLSRGEVDEAFATAGHQLSGELEIGGQDQFYLEGQIAMAIPGEDGTMHIYSSTQFPMEIQAAVARSLGREFMHNVVVECRRMGGAFGGKESQAAFVACIAAVLAERTGCPVKLRLDRDDDMRMTGKRHDFQAGGKQRLTIRASSSGYRVELASRCGRSADLSGAINDRAMLHSDNAYFLPQYP